METFFTKRATLCLLVALRVGPFFLNLALVLIFFLNSRNQNFTLGLVIVSGLFSFLPLRNLRQSGRFSKSPSLKLLLLSLITVTSALFCTVAARVDLAPWFFVAALFARFMVDRLFEKATVALLGEPDGLTAEERKKLRRTLAHLATVTESIKREHQELSRKIDTWVDEEPKDFPLIYPLVEQVLDSKRGEWGDLPKFALECVIDVRAKTVRAAVDPSAFRQLLSDLLTHTSEAMGAEFGTITITLSLKKKDLSLRILDTGKGLSSSVELEPLQRLVTSWGGRLDISRVQGKGTTISLCLPAKRRGAHR